MYCNATQPLDLSNKPATTRRPLLKALKAQPRCHHVLDLSGSLKLKPATTRHPLLKVLKAQYKIALSRSG